MRAASVAAAVVGLAVLVGVECLPPSPQPPSAPAPPPARSEQPTIQIDPGWRRSVLDRPLFSPDRRPIGAAPPDIAAAADTAAPVLTGVIVWRADRSAIFAMAGTERPVIAHEGDRVGAIVIDAIQPGQVAVSGPAGNAVWHVGLGSFVAPAPAPAPPTEDERHTRGTDGQHAE